MRYQLDQLAEAVALVGDKELAAQAAQLASEVAAIDIDALLTPDDESGTADGVHARPDGTRAPHVEALYARLGDLASDLTAYSARLSSRHFVRKPTQRQQQAPTWATPWQRA